MTNECIECGGLIEYSPCEEVRKVTVKEWHKLGCKQLPIMLETNFNS